MNIFENSNYKHVLKLILKQSHRKTGQFRKLAEHLGVHATLISQVLSGEKDFSEEQLWSVCEYLGLSKAETTYLLCLLKKERAGSKKLKNHYEEQRAALQAEALQVSNRVPKERQLSEIERAIFYSSWIYSAVHLFTSLEKEIRFEDVCERFQISVEKARGILDFLISIEMVLEKNGAYTMGPGFTHLSKKSPFILKHHTNWRLKAIQAAENLTDEELIYTVNVSLSKTDFSRLREDMIQFIQEFLKTIKTSPAEELAQFNLDFFWIGK